MTFDRIHLNDPIQSFVLAELRTKDPIDQIHQEDSFDFCIWDLMFDATCSGYDAWHMVDDEQSVHFCGIKINGLLYAARWFYNKESGDFSNFSAYRIKL